MVINACNLMCGYSCLYILCTCLFLHSFYSGAYPTDTIGAYPTTDTSGVYPTTDTSEAQQPTQVVPSQRKGNKHRYPIAANGKLLDIAVIGEEKSQPQLKSPKVNLHWRTPLPDTDSEDEIEELPVPATPRKGELGKKD